MSLGAHFVFARAHLSIVLAVIFNKLEIYLEYYVSREYFSSNRRRCDCDEVILAADRLKLAFAELRRDIRFVVATRKEVTP